MKSKPLISLIVIVYNHEQYIKSALDSFLSQQGAFDLEIILSNDCSTDETHDKILQVIERNKSNIKIKYTNQTANLGLINNFLYCLDKCEGGFIAICAGDDYWIDDRKLEKQLVFMQNNEEYIAVTSDTYYLKEDNYLDYTCVQTKGSWLGFPIGKEFSFSQIANRFYPHPNTLLFRKENLILPKDFSTFMCEDYPLFLILASSGRVGYINEVQTAYRIHPSSFVQTALKENNSNSLKFMRIGYSINSFLNNRFKKEFIYALRKDYLRTISKLNRDKILLLNLELFKLETEFKLNAFNSLVFFWLRLANKKNKLITGLKNFIKK